MSSRFNSNFGRFSPHPHSIIRITINHKMGKFGDEIKFKTIQVEPGPDC